MLESNPSYDFEEVEEDPSVSWQKLFTAFANHPEQTDVHIGSTVTLSFDLEDRHYEAELEVESMDPSGVPNSAIINIVGEKGIIYRAFGKARWEEGKPFVETPPIEHNIFGADWGTSRAAQMVTPGVRAAMDMPIS